MTERIVLILVGTGIGWVVSWYRHLVAENANLISDHIRDMERFAEALLIHWATPYEEIEKNEQKSEIAKIKALHSSIAAFYGEARSRLGTNQHRKYQAKQVELFKAGLGGEFETLGRGVSENTVIDTQTIAWEIIQILRVARREQYGVKAIFTSFRSKV